MSIGSWTAGAAVDAFTTYTWADVAGSIDLSTHLSGLAVCGVKPLIGPGIGAPRDPSWDAYYDLSGLILDVTTTDGVLSWSAASLTLLATMVGVGYPVITDYYPAAGFRIYLTGTTPGGSQVVVAVEVYAQDPCGDPFYCHVIAYGQYCPGDCCESLLADPYAVASPDQSGSGGTSDAAPEIGDECDTDVHVLTVADFAASITIAEAWEDVTLCAARNSYISEACDASVDLSGLELTAAPDGLGGTTLSLAAASLVITENPGSPSGLPMIQLAGRCTIGGSPFVWSLDVIVAHAYDITGDPITWTRWTCASA